MPFKITTFSYDQTAKKATVNLSNEHGDFLGFIFNLPSSPNDTIEKIRENALQAIEGLVHAAVQDALLPPHPDQQHPH